MISERRSSSPAANSRPASVSLTFWPSRSISPRERVASIFRASACFDGIADLILSIGTHPT